MKIFVVHYDKLIERKKNILNQLGNNNLEAEFISNYGKEVLTSENKKKFKNISESEISTFLHHIECYNKIIENKNDYALILEDDALFDNKFNVKLQNCIIHLPSFWDILYIGQGDIRIPYHVIKNKCNIYRKPNSEFKYTDFYLIKYDICKNIIDHFNSDNIINLPIDLYLHEFINKKNIYKVFFSEPNLVSQGSINKTFFSTIWHSKIDPNDTLERLNPNYRNVI